MKTKVKKLLITTALMLAIGSAGLTANAFPKVNGTFTVAVSDTGKMSKMSTDKMKKKKMSKMSHDKMKKDTSKMSKM